MQHIAGGRALTNARQARQELHDTAYRRLIQASPSCFARRRARPSAKTASAISAPPEPFEGEVEQPPSSSFGGVGLLPASVLAPASEPGFAPQLPMVVLVDEQAWSAGQPLPPAPRHPVTQAPLLASHTLPLLAAPHSASDAQGAPHLPAVH